MKKYRIISESNQSFTNVIFYIEVKKWYGWRKVRMSDNNKFKDLEFKTYSEAENHMKNHYFSDGWVSKPYPNEYHFKKATYYGY
jgi:hypothetical protein